MFFSLRGVHVPHRKNTADTSAIRLPAPSVVTIPMSMHIGKPAIPTVKVGDTVKVGTLIGEQDGFISSPVYSSVSGKVIKISDIPLSNGGTSKAVVIESDSELSADPSVAPPTVDSADSLIAAIKKSGVVGLGGAGFPTYVKFSVEPSKIEELVINGAECEPYITSDSYTMCERSDDMALAFSAIKKHLGVKKIIIGIENNKKRAIEKMQMLAKADNAITVKVLPSIYPQGGEKVLVYHTTGKTIPAGKLPIDVGCIVCNCTTIAAIGSYIKTGMPIVNKCVTVDGGAVAEPKIVIAPIGTSISELIDFCGGFKCDPAKVLYGGPMMGITVPSLELPVLKNTNAIVALSEKEAAEPKVTACIRCGNCTNHCPFGINPAAIARAYNKGDTDALKKLRVDICMECGCCSYICPANRPLVQTNKLSKALLREEKMKEDAKK